METGAPTKAPGLGARVLGAFAALILAFGAAAAFSLSAQQQALRRLDEVHRQEEAAQAAVGLAMAVRQLYIEQAHAILLGGSDQLGRYADALREVSRALEAAQASRLFASDPDAARGIADAVFALERVFGEQIVPAMRAGDWAKVRSEHLRSEDVAARIVDQTDRLQRTAHEEVARVRNAAEAQAARLRALTLALLGVAVAIALLVGAYLLRTVVRPLRELIWGARRVGEGDLSVRLEVKSRDEVGRLADSFNRMAQALEENQARLVSAEKLAGLGRMAAGVAHELNNPLGVAKGYVRLLRRQAPEPIQADLGIVDSEIARCQQIVEELLGLARDTKELRADRVDLRELAGEAVRRQRALEDLSVPSCPVELGEMPALWTRGDPDRLAQVLSNLLRNAAQAAGPSGKVAVAGGAEGESVWLAVEDTGPGLSPEVRARLFEPFFTTKPKGTGLGLAVSLAIARAHRGTLAAEPRAGGGARFTLKLPRAEERT